MLIFFNVYLTLGLCKGDENVEGTVEEVELDLGASREGSRTGKYHLLITYFFIIH